MKTDKMNKIYPGASILAFICTAMLLLFSGCGDNACVELGYKECECCDSSKVESCKDAVSAANDIDSPPSEAIDLCEAALSLFKSCDQLNQNSLDQLCNY